MMNGQQPQPQPQIQVDGNMQVPITLSIVTWHTILGIIADAPWKTANPLIQELNAQLAARVQERQQPQPQSDSVVAN